MAVSSRQQRKKTQQGTRKLGTPKARGTASRNVTAISLRRLRQDVESFHAQLLGQIDFLLARVENSPLDSE